HHEGKTRRLGACLFEQCAMPGADKAQMIGAAALHEAQIGGVIDDAGKVGVLVIDANGHDVTAIPQLAVERVHRHGTRSPIATSQLLLSNGVGEIEARSTSSRQRTLTSILSGSERRTYNGWMPQCVQNVCRPVPVLNWFVLSTSLPLMSSNRSGGTNRCR